MQHTPELDQPEKRARKELQSELAYDGVKTSIPKRQRLTISRYRPKNLVVQPGARAFKHRRRDVRANH
jgi:hypothetical protein